MLALLSAPLMSAAQTSAPKPPMEELLVKGQKIERSLQDTKESVAVFTEQSLKERNLLSLDEVYQQTPGVTGSNDEFRIRGMSSGQTGILRTTLASIYVDGVVLTGWAAPEGPRQMWDVERVEILRGPQSTNVGRNALAGAVIIHTNNPIYDNTATLQAGIGDYGLRELRAMGNLNVADGRSAIRATYENSEQDGFIDNITRNEDDFGYDERQTLRLKWLWDVADDLRVVLSYQNIDNAYGDERVLIEGAGYKPEDRISTSNVRGSYAIEADLASLTMDYDIDEHWSIKAITAGLQAYRDRVSDFDQTEQDQENGGGIVMRTAEDENLSQELRFNYRGQRWLGSSGLYLANAESYNTNDTTVLLDLEQQINAQMPGLGTNLVGLGVYPQYYDLSTGGFNRMEVTTQALFSEWEYRATERLRISFGARYDREEQDIAKQNLGDSNTELPTTPSGYGEDVDGAIALINPQLAALSVSGPEEKASTDFDAFLPHVGATFDWNDQLSTSFFVKRGYRSGGTEVTGTGAVNPYDPEYLLSYEFALRAELLDGRASVNANAYYGDWKDQQVDVPEIEGSNIFYRLENAGESELYGLEVDARLQFNSQLAVYAAAALNYTEYKTFQALDRDYSGNEFKYAPTETAALGANYDINRYFFVNANITYQGESYADDANEIELDSHALVNAIGGYRSDRIGVELYVRNLFDETYTTSEFGFQDANGSYDKARVGDPRQIGMRVTFTF